MGNVPIQFVIANWLSLYYDSSMIDHWSIDHSLTTFNQSEQNEVKDKSAAAAAEIFQK